MLKTVFPQYELIKMPIKGNWKCNHSMINFKSGIPNAFQLIVLISSERGKTLKKYSVNNIPQTISVSLCNENGHLFTKGKKIFVTLTAQIVGNRQSIVHHKLLAERIEFVNGKSVLQRFETTLSDNCVHFGLIFRSFIVQDSEVLLRYSR